MRIISGKHKGRRITAPKKLPVRPTTDRAKEALFNILNHRLEWENISSLDLYAGTGNISYELASRGVTKLTAVDQNKHCAHFIYQTNEALGLSITVVKNSVEKFLANPSGSFDFIFADPPHAITEDMLLSLANTLLENNWITENGLLIIEHDKHLNLKSHQRFSEERTYGSSRFSFFE